MKIYTKKGDSGTTQLIGGARIPKSSIRIDAYGTVDELNSFIGLLRDQSIDSIYKTQILEIQDRLFTLGSTLATDPQGTKMKLPELSENDVTNLEKWMDTMDESLEPMRNFILPGGHTTVSFCHISRCVCRRAERLTVELYSHEDVPLLAITYLNRLSDYLFVLGRKLTKDLGAEEHPWIARV